MAEGNGSYGLLTGASNSCIFCSIRRNSGEDDFGMWQWDRETAYANLVRALGTGLPPGIKKDDVYTAIDLCYGTNGRPACTGKEQIKKILISNGIRPTVRQI